MTHTLSDGNRIFNFSYNVDFPRHTGEQCCTTVYYYYYMYIPTVCMSLSVAHVPSHYICHFQCLLENESFLREWLIFIFHFVDTAVGG